MASDDLSPVVAPVATGNSNDIVQRIKRLIPFRWFSYVAPLRDAILGGLSDLSAQGYSFIQYARLQTRLYTATGPWLDVFSYDYLRRFLLRNGSTDGVFRATIQATILQERVTRKGMVSALTKLLNIPPFIFEPWNPGDAGGYNTPGFAYGQVGGWGSLLYPGQVFMRVSRAGLAASGVPNVTGWYRGQGSIGPGGYGQGSIEYVGVDTAEIGVTDNDIYRVIANTKPTGVTCWIQIGSSLVLSQVPASSIPTGGIAPTLPLVQAETQPHFIGKFTPTPLRTIIPARFN